MFSVIIPAYNCENTIFEALNSVKNQTAINLVKEIIIINDGSTDNTKDVIYKFMQENSNLCFIYKENENHGVSYTRNYGINLANSEWIALLDSDDIWLPRKLEIQSLIILQNPSILFLGSAYPLKILFKKKEGLHKITPRELCLRSLPTTPSVVFKKDVGKVLGLFNENMKYCEDINFFQKFLKYDSYYILGKELVKIGINKKYHGSSGLSSNFIEMNKGRNQNVKELYNMGLISCTFMILMILLNYIKLFRRIILKVINYLFRKRK